MLQVVKLNDAPKSDVARYDPTGIQHDRTDSVRTRQIGFHVDGETDPTRSDVIFATPDGVPGRALITSAAVTNPDKNSMMMVCWHWFIPYFFPHAPEIKIRIGAYVCMPRGRAEYNKLRATAHEYSLCVMPCIRFQKTAPRHTKTRHPSFAKHRSTAQENLFADTSTQRCHLTTCRHACR
jgi:hypothetical protein